MFRSTLNSCAIFFVFLSVLGQLSAQEEGSKLNIPDVLVDALVMEEQKLQPELLLPGVVEPLIQGKLTSEIRGIVTRVEKKLGERVRSGDVIMYIKNTQVGQSFREYAVRSPVDGVVTSLPLVTGSFTEPNGDLGSVTDTNSFKIVGQVPAVHLASLKKGQKATFEIGREVIQARISGVAREVKISTGTARVELTPLKQMSKLVSGSVGELTIYMAELETLAIPLSAMVDIGESVYVRKIVDDKVEVVEVELGRMIGQQRVVLGGLKAGDEIVTRATDYLKEGDPIRRTEKNQASQ